MSALYFAVLKPEDRVAVKPHASPVFHAIQYLFGNQTREKLENFRGFKGAQSYPSRTKDIDDVDFSTGSVGLGVAQTLFSSLVQDYVKAHGWMKDRAEGRMVALVGDAEMDEGNIFEACWRAGSTACATPGGSSTTTARASTPWCARGSTTASSHVPQFRLGRRDR
jgi:pyruvate dehydrogenase E1 component